ncbi:GAF domain-containing protein [Sorangium sp. So ce136]|uniref:GAF domain-containing protein n=1 Tax=Sorangium sp. So ce136 TaxID=3133284 RepID=UPI003F044707
MKLLCKPADERYPGAQALKVDVDAYLRRWDARAGTASWDLGALAEPQLLDDGASSAQRPLDQLSPAARRAVALGACIGHELDAATLSQLAEQSQAEVTALLREAESAGILAPQRTDDAPQPLDDDALRLRFLHDGVHQAAYAALPDAERCAVHLRLGRMAEARSQHQRSDEALFEATQHLNLGAPLIVEPRERAELAAMNLTAGLKAKERGAPPAAAGFFEAGISALPDGSFRQDHELAFSLHAEAAECAYLGGQLERAESLLDVLAAEARSDLERARAHELRIAVYTTQGRLDQALALGKTALAMLGVYLPEEGPARKAAADAELAAARAALGTRRLKDLLGEPETSDARTRAALRLLMSVTLPAASVSPPLCTFVAARQVNLSLEHGHGGASPYGYMAYAWVAARMFRRYDEAYELGELALELNERSGQHELSCRLRLLLGAHISVFTKHLLSSLDLFKEAQEAGLRTGDLTYLAQACVHTAVVRFGLGDECEAVRAEVDGFLSLARRAREELAVAALTSVRRALDELMSPARGGATLAPESGAVHGGLDEEKLAAPSYSAVAFIHHALKQQLCYLHEDHEGALRMGSLAEAKMQGGVGDHLATEVFFYTCLAQLSPALSRGRQLSAASLPSYRDRLAEWAEQCPDNYRHKHLLVRAESARAAGEELAAMKLYDQAIEVAKVNGFVRDEALASELCAKFHLASGRERIAHVYMTDAHEGYARWGATAKVRQLSRKYPHLVARVALLGQQSRPPEVSAPASVERSGSLDAMAVLRASRAICGELVLERLFERLLRVLLESTGARRAVLLLERDGALTVEAERTIDPEAIRIGPATPLDSAADLAVSVVRHVAQTQQPVVLAGAAADDRFADDPYVVESNGRSLLCVAMTHQGRLAGVLYMEGDAVAGAFRAGQVELCCLLASQAAVALHNALRHREAQETSSELRRTNEALAAEVARLSEELRRARCETPNT